MCYARRQRSSWARIKLSKILYHFTFRCNNLFSSFCSSFTFCLSSISSQFELFEYTSHFFVFALYFSLCCSIFNDRSRLPQGFLAATLVLYHTVFHLSIPFWNFFQVFFNFFSSSSVSTLSGDSLHIISLSFYFVKGFLKSFFRFVQFYALN